MPKPLPFHTRAAQNLHEERRRLCDEWLERLVKLLPVPAREVFPSDALLDHVPDLLAGIAKDLASPEEDELAANSLVTDRAHSLGALRFEQDATIHQMMREFDLLALVLDEFLVREAERSPEPSAAEALLVQSRLHRAIRLLLQATIDTFIEHYTQTIEEQRDRLASYNRMVSHELRTPIGTIEMASELLATSDGDPEEQGRLRDVLRRNATRSRQILEGLDHMRHETSMLGAAPNVQIVDVGAMVSDVSQRLSDIARERGVEIRVDAGLPKIECDVAKLEMVFRNLISNGIKYSDPSRSERYVRIAPAAQASPGDDLDVEVSDNGVGIPAERLESVFERFARAHKDEDARLGVDGHGLGLAIVRDCMKALGGRVDLESRVGRGSTFRLRLPRRPPAR